MLTHGRLTPLPLPSILPNHLDHAPYSRMGASLLTTRHTHLSGFAPLPRPRIIIIRGQPEHRYITQSSKQRHTHSWPLGSSPSARCYNNTNTLNHAPQYLMGTSIPLAYYPIISTTPYSLIYAPRVSHAPYITSVSIPPPLGARAVAQQLRQSSDY